MVRRIIVNDREIRTLVKTLPANVQKAVNELIFISNSVVMGRPLEIHEAKKRIEKLLGFNFFQ